MTKAAGRRVDRRAKSCFRAPIGAPHPHDVRRQNVTEALLFTLAVLLVLWLMVVPWIGYGVAAAVLDYAFYDFTGGLKLWTLSVSAGEALYNSSRHGSWPDVWLSRLCWVFRGGAWSGFVHRH